MYHQPLELLECGCRPSEELLASLWDELDFFGLLPTTANPLAVPTMLPAAVLANEGGRRVGAKGQG